jgi:tRNA pseudouridine55 synthase
MTKEEFIEGQVIVIDKPLHWTSFNVVKKIEILLRKQFNLKKIKVGHAGTLDPLATGILIVCTGKMTKKITTFQDAEKEYVATIEFGKTTPSYDLESEYDAEYPTSHITQLLIEEKMKQFIGEIDQIPPLFSAKMVDGRRAYMIARSGSDMVLKANKITIYELEVLSFIHPVAQIRIKCSKGTYIRSFAHDLGKAVNSGAHLSGLIRTCSGNYKIKDAISIDEFQENLLTLQP